MDGAMPGFLQDILPDYLLSSLKDYASRIDGPLNDWTRAVADQATHCADFVQPYVLSLAESVSTMATPLLDRVALAVYNSPDVVVLGLVLVLFILVLQVLSLIRRLVAWWTRLAFRLLFWSGAVLLVAAIWQRGVQQSVLDASAILGRLIGYAAFVRDIWQVEYRKYQQQQVQAAVLNGRHANAHPQGFGRGRSAGR